MEIFWLWYAVTSLLAIVIGVVGVRRGWLRFDKR